MRLDVRLQVMSLLCERDNTQGVHVPQNIRILNYKWDTSKSFTLNQSLWLIPVISTLLWLKQDSHHFKGMQVYRLRHCLKTKINCFYLNSIFITYQQCDPSQVSSFSETLFLTYKTGSEGHTS